MQNKGILAQKKDRVHDPESYSSIKNGLDKTVRGRDINSTVKGSPRCTSKTCMGTFSIFYKLTIWITIQSKVLKKYLKTTNRARTKLLTGIDRAKYDGDTYIAISYKT